jgi:hypothetical protein
MQRTWVQSQRTVSEQAIRQIVVQFLNLCTGSHRNSYSFWSSLVKPACKVRFGISALADGEELSSEYLFSLHRSIGNGERNRENYLSAMIRAVCKNAGVKLTEACLEQFKANSSRATARCSDTQKVPEPSIHPSSGDTMGTSGSMGGFGYAGSGSSSSSCTYELDWCSIDAPDLPPLIADNIPELIHQESTPTTSPMMSLSANGSASAAMYNTTCGGDMPSNSADAEAPRVSIDTGRDACLGFEFVTADIVALEPVVKHMHQVYLHA